jgi:predicted RNase H-like HicB family nuclease
MKGIGLVKDYHINLLYGDEDGGYIADMPDLARCPAFGHTREETLREVLRAKEAWLEAARNNDKPTPLPRYRPAIYQVT